VRNNYFKIQVFWNVTLSP